MNVINISGTVTEREGVRFTPGGVEVFEGTLHHQCEVVEADVVRKLEFDYPAVAFGPVAHRLNREALGVAIKAKGFLAPRYMRSSRLIVHITEYI